MTLTKRKLRRAFRAAPLGPLPAARLRIMLYEHPQGVRAPRGTITR